MHNPFGLEQIQITQEQLRRRAADYKAAPRRRRPARKVG
jgi:hypothetical protein